MGELYDVIAVDIETRKVRVMERSKTLRNADAIATMAVMRRGVDKEFFMPAEADKYKDGDIY